jgi:hypothetical protein
MRLTAGEFARFEDKWPRSKGDRAIESRAVEIAKLHLRRQNADVTFPKPPRGADLSFMVPGSAAAQAVEVRGTASEGMAWVQLKVSSEVSLRLIKNGMAVYRVCAVFSRSPAVHVLHYGRDFMLDAEGEFVPINPAQKVFQRMSSEGSKYAALRDWLAEQEGTEVTLPLREADELLGFALPLSARRYQAFWANQTDTSMRPWAKAWQDAGFRVDSLQLTPDGWVRFKRNDG